MNTDEIRSRVLDIVRDILCDQDRELSLSDRLVRDLKIQSDDLSFSLVPAVEKTFDLRVPLEEWGSIYTIGDVVDLVRRHLAASEI